MRLDELERELRAERPEIGPEFARELDEWAAAGFPRDGRPGRRGDDAAGARGWLARLRERLAATPPRRVLAPAGAVATLLVVTAVAISQSGGIESDDAAPPSGAGDEGGASGAAGAPLAEPAAERPAPVEEATAEAARRAGGGAASSALGGGQVAEDSALAVPPVPPPGGGGGGIAAGAEERLVDASAHLVLGAEAGEVQETANEVVAVTDRHDGIVITSQVTSDDAGARALFELEVPFRELDAALTDLSALGDVLSRTEASEDITAKALRPQRRLAAVLDDLRRRQQDLIVEDDPARRRLIRSDIRFLKATANGLRRQIAGVERQGRFATVTVEVTSAGAEEDEGGWSLEDAADDAVRVLEVIGGVALVSLAVLLPAALVGALAWLALARARQRSRERALDG